MKQKFGDIMKRTICLLLSTILIFALMGCGGSANTAVSEFEYSAAENGIYINKYLANDQTVVIPQEIDGKTVVGIGYRAFMSANITSVTIPDSVTAIMDEAFLDCRSLTEVTLSKNLKTIHKHAFNGCSSLKKVSLPQGLEEMGDFAFSGCVSLEEINIPNTLKEFGLKCFYQNTSLTKVTFEEGLTGIRGTSIFYGSSALKEVTIPETVTQIYDIAFSGCDSLKKITFMGDVPQEMGGNVFDSPNKNVKIYHKKTAKGWDDTTLKKDYTLVEY